MADQPTRPEPEAPGREGPQSSGEYIKPRLRAHHRLAGGWAIRVSLATINPRRLTFALTGPQDATRTLIATQDFGSTFVEVIELDDWRELFFDPAVEPDIARYVVSAVDIQWPMGPRGVARRTVA